MTYLVEFNKLWHAWRAGLVTDREKAERMLLIRIGIFYRR